MPVPLSPADRALGYWWALSMRQIEVARTLVFDQPRNGRAFFEALVADNLHLGRPEQIELIFGRRILPTAPGVFATRVVTRGVDVTIHVGYKHSRTGTTSKKVGRCGSRRCPTTRPISACCVVWSICPNFSARPVTSTADCWTMNRSVRAASLRVQPLSGSRDQPWWTVTGPSLEVRRPSGPSPGRRPRHHRPPDRRLHQPFPPTPGWPVCSASPTARPRCCYDLRRLQLKGLIVRLPHSNTYVLTDDGQRFAVFYTKIHNRLLRPLMAADQPPAPIEVRRALNVLDHAVTDYIDKARIAA